MIQSIISTVIPDLLASISFPAVINCKSRVALAAVVVVVVVEVVIVSSKSFLFVAVVDDDDDDDDDVVVGGVAACLLVTYDIAISFSISNSYETLYDCLFPLSILSFFPLCIR